MCRWILWRCPHSQELPRWVKELSFIVLANNNTWCLKPSANFTVLIPPKKMSFITDISDRVCQAQKGDGEALWKNNKSLSETFPFEWDSFSQRKGEKNTRHWKTDVFDSGRIKITKYVWETWIYLTSSGKLVPPECGYCQHHFNVMEVAAYFFPSVLSHTSEWKGLLNKKKCRAGSWFYASVVD